MNVLQLNKAIKRIAIIPEICHCTNRFSTSNANLVKAFCKMSGDEKGRLQWHTSGGLVRFTLSTPFGAQVGDNMSIEATEEQIFDCIHSMYVKMHVYWTGTEEV